MPLNAWAKIRLQIFAAGYFLQGVEKIASGGMLKAVAQEVDTQSLTKCLLAEDGLQGFEGSSGFAIDDAAVTGAVHKFPARAHDGIFVGTGEIA